ncbi:MAG: hypothetical protein NTW14_01195 [bacterium]|nr:hypothetical protein [bacterium]
MDSLELENRIEQLVATAGFRLISARWHSTKRHAQLRVIVDAEDHNITIYECVELSRAISDLLDSYPHEFPDYRLEVSSPGLNHPLLKWQFQKNLGRLVEVRFEREGKRYDQKGNLVSSDETTFIIEGEKGRMNFEIETTEVFVVPVIT